MTITIANQGTPSVSRIATYNLVKILKSWGANAHIFWASSPQIASSSILKGSAQVLESTIPNLLPGVENGLDVEAFGLGGPKLDYALVASKKITSLSQLKGKTIGVYNGSPSDITWVLLQQALKQANLTTNDVHIIQAGGQTNRIDALAGGRIVASPLGHLALLQLKSQGAHNLYDFTQHDPNLYNDVLWAKPSWLAAHQKLAVAINMAELESFRQLSNPADTQKLVAEDVADTSGGVASQALSIIKLFQQYNLYPGNAIMTTSALRSQEKLFYTDHTIPQLWALSKWATVIYGQAALKVVGPAPSGTS